jgi:neuraminyllactose-binding hemagglutinin
MSNKFSLAREMLKIGLLGLFAAILFSGCATKLAMKVEKGTADYNFETTVIKGKQTSLVIAIVDSSMASGKTDNALNELSKALSVGLSEIITKKGFKLKGPYQAYDDITYRDKKMIYLAIVPKMEINIGKTIQNRKSHKLYYHEEGIINMSGSLILSVDEPMTGQTFIKKRISLHDLNIQEPYIFEEQTSYGDGSLIGKALDSLNADKILQNNLEVAKASALTKFYKNAMSKIEQYLDREEMISFKEDILKLKGLKRF